VKHIEDTDFRWFKVSRDFRPTQVAAETAQFVTLCFRQCQSARAVLSEKVPIDSINLYIARHFKKTSSTAC